MNIIFGQDIQELQQRYVVLELDTFANNDGVQQTAYCLVEGIPESDWPLMEIHRRAHHDLMEAYRDRDWEYCLHTIRSLRGHWNGELDSFYDDLAARVEANQINPPGPGWTGVRHIPEFSSSPRDSDIINVSTAKESQ
jgi:hypothetical protein